MTDPIRPNVLAAAAEWRVALEEAEAKIESLTAALKDAERERERLKRRWLCDCHTWPGPDEAHAYIVALEQENERVWGLLRRVVSGAETAVIETALAREIAEALQGPAPQGAETAAKPVTRHPRPSDDDPIRQRAWDRLHEAGFVEEPAQGAEAGE